MASKANRASRVLRANREHQEPLVGLEQPAMLDRLEHKDHEARVDHREALDYQVIGVVPGQPEQLASLVTLVRLGLLDLRDHRESLDHKVELETPDRLVMPDKLELLAQVDPKVL
jgi:hypothetical protein